MRSNPLAQPGGSAACEYSAGYWAAAQEICRGHVPQFASIDGLQTFKAEPASAHASLTLACHLEQIHMKVILSRSSGSLVRLVMGRRSHLRLLKERMVQDHHDDTDLPQLMLLVTQPPALHGIQRRSAPPLPGCCWHQRQQQPNAGYLRSWHSQEHLHCL